DFALLRRFVDAALTVDLADVQAVEQAMGISLHLKPNHADGQTAYAADGAGAVDLVDYRALGDGACLLELRLTGRAVGQDEIAAILEPITGSLTPPLQDNPLYADIVPGDMPVLPPLDDPRYPKLAAFPVSTICFHTAGRSIMLSEACWYGSEVADQPPVKTAVYAIAIGVRIGADGRPQPLDRPVASDAVSSQPYPDEFEFEKDGPWNPQPRTVDTPWEDDGEGPLVPPRLDEGAEAMDDPFGSTSPDDPFSSADRGKPDA
ncbi:MAG: hypothetical protein KDA49_02790, partial [Rhodospirillaceae bacterium]|nr:hypothetical protein [Rhodospirillaceae bacterium]